ncbi:hypothetical protein [Xylophilus sp. GOD-11R]|uniref:hypothetical protein n=1 Tax=Xylophilus sp. GOD-11R TaxID=3089814 RepID=UPI00298C4C7C|nr:hypothetical protein [Xylophilus sp. GOD-11R]WPB56584.1 hypothetical protein R9X41_20970 [Xylophilus sp. GOD-11R]
MSRPEGPVEPTAKQRLQATRQAMMNELVPSTRPSAPRKSIEPLVQRPSADASPEQLGYEAAIGQDEADRLDTGTGWFSVARRSLRAWWEFHPVRVVGSIAEPVLVEYARQRPLKLMGIAAGVGAVLVITRPWRLVSIGGLAVAALKSSQVSNFALSLLSSRGGKG